MFFKKPKVNNTANNIEYKSLNYSPNSTKYGIKNENSHCYENFCKNGYLKNPIVHRLVNLVSTQAAYIKFNVETGDDDDVARNLLLEPNNYESATLFRRKMYNYLLLSGNCYIKINREQGQIKTMEILEPKTMAVIVDKDGNLLGYKYKKANQCKNYMINKTTGACDVLHIKNFNPMSQYYGLSSLQAAFDAVSQHNEITLYSRNLLENAAKPSGALILKPSESNNYGHLTDEQYERLKSQIEENYSTNNVGKPMLLEGGLEWKEMSFRPSDMNLSENKDNLAREVAIAFGVPSQILGIPGDNKYANMIEARKAFLEQTIDPLVDMVRDSIQMWFKKVIDERVVAVIDNEQELNKQNDAKKQKSFGGLKG